MARTPPFGLKSFRNAQRFFTDLLRCPTCGKSRTVLNVASRGFKPETVTEKTHCTCPGGTVELHNRGMVKPLHVVEGDE
jgi:hypothetical protein